MAVFPLTQGIGERDMIKNVCRFSRKVVVIVVRTLLTDFHKKTLIKLYENQSSGN
jgi:hypothetical protein